MLSATATIHALGTPLLVVISLWYMFRTRSKRGTPSRGRERFEYLDFRGIPLVETVEKTAGVRLEDIYIPLRASPLESVGGSGEQSIPEENLESSFEIKGLLSKESALIILGNPGSGKSTLLKHYTIELTNNTEGRHPASLPQLPLAAITA